MKPIILTLLLLTSCLYKIYGCSCRSISVKQAFEKSDFVVEGIITSKSVKRYKTNSNNEWRVKSIKVIKYKVEITTIFKGMLERNTLYVYSDMSSCGMYMTIGTKYIIYSTNDSYSETIISSKKINKATWTNQCSRTTNEIEKETQCLTNMELTNCYCENITWKKECR